MDGSGIRQLVMTLAFLHTATGITLIGSSSTALLGGSFQFTCTVTGLSTKSLLIFKRNIDSACTVSLTPCQQLRTTAAYNCSCGQPGMYHMDIASVSLADDDIWTCQYSQTSNQVTLSVYYGPFNNVTVDKTSPMTVIEDVTVSLTARCSAICNPDCTYTWSKGTQQVSDNGDLPVGSFRRGQAGEYRCTARNTATRDTAVSQTVTVNVQWYPEPPTHNCPSWIVPGQTTGCTCQTSDRGKPEGVVQWISPGGQTVSSSGSSGQLNLTSIPRSDSGMNYICRANNSLPNSNSDVTYVVHIAYLDKPNITLDRNDVYENDTVNITCTVDSNPPAKMAIGNGKQEIQTVSNNIKSSMFAGLCSHIGTVTCQAENNQTKSVSRSTAQVNVKCAPRTGVSMSRTTVVHGKLMEFVSLTANVIANPLPNFTWYKHTPEGELVLNGKESFIDSSGLRSTLKVRIKIEEDFTNYSVVVKNNIGNTSLLFRLTKEISSQDETFTIIPVAVAVGAAAVVIWFIAISVCLHRRGVLKCTGSSNRKDSPEPRGNGTHAPDNVSLNDVAKCGRDEDGLLYVGVEFGHQTAPTAAPKRVEEATEYAGIAHGVVGPPPQDKDDKKE